jgi:hypothetical protein
MPDGVPTHPKVLVADERQKDLEPISEAVRDLGQVSRILRTALERSREHAALMAASASPPAA